MTIANLRKLAAIINSALDTLERELAAESLEFPALDVPYDSTAPAERVLERESAAHAVDLIVAASSQLCASVRKPTITTVELAWQHMLPAALRFLTAIDVVELLDDAGAKGMHVQDIAQKADVDSEKLAHALRFCATYHVFTEVAPDVFANNRISSVLNKGKSYDVLQTMSGFKYDDSNGHAARLDMNISTFLLASGALTQHYTDPRTKFSKEPTCTALARGAGFEGKSFFGWLEEPQNGPRLQTFGVAMRATTAWETQDAILEGFDWSNLPEHLLTTTLLERYTSRREFERRIRRMNARSYYRWLFTLAEQHRGAGLHPQYTPGHSAALDLPAALNTFADHYATKAQSHTDDLPAAPTPSFAMDDYTYWTAPDGWVEASMRDFYSHHRARQQGLSLSGSRGGRMAVTLYAGPRPEYPYTRAYASYSAAVQLYARSGQLPTARTLADRNRSMVCTSPMCRHGCIALEDDYHVFVNCPRYVGFRLESAAELARRIRRRLATALSDEQSAGIIAASETFYTDSDLWPTTHAMYFLGLTPKLAGLIPRAAFSSNTSYRMSVSACEVDWHYAAIRLAGRIWGDFQSQSAKRNSGL